MIQSWSLMPVGLPLWWPLSWAVVVAALVVTLWPRGVHARWKWTVVGCVALTSCWPAGGWSGYVALALQSPSLVGAAWACGVLWHAWCSRRLAPERTLPLQSDTACQLPTAALWLLTLLGWALVIDTLNRWPDAWALSVYAWGCQAYSLWLSALVLALMAWRSSGPWVWWAVAVLAVFVLTRWPSGNLWDAWLDPVVWVVAQGVLLKRGWRCWRGVSR